MILGIDEAGRGPWAGPLVVGAVVLGGVEIEGLTDSKKLSKKKREIYDLAIREKAVGYGLGWVSAHELDEIGMSEALRRATIRAVQAVSCSYSEIIIDGTVNFLSETAKGKYVKTMPKADLLIPSVSAASIIAKQARDAYMMQLDSTYHEYGFGSHMGYGTARHRKAIDAYGPTGEHRLSFAPLRHFAEERRAEIDHREEGAISAGTTITTKKVGDAAEAAVAKYLVARGHCIVERNWRTRVCEIDIVSIEGETLYFTEVKYRKTSAWGDGLSAISAKKLSQMHYAADVYIARNRRYAGWNRQLAVSSVNGDRYTVTSWFALEDT